MSENYVRWKIVYQKTRWGLTSYFRAHLILTHADGWCSHFYLTSDEMRPLYQAVHSMIRRLRYEHPRLYSHCAFEEMREG